MFALNGNPLPDISTGAAGEILRIDGAGTALEWFASAVSSDWFLDSHGSGAAVAQGTFTSVACSAAKPRWLLVLMVRQNNVNGAGQIRIRVNGEHGAGQYTNFSMSALGVITPVSETDILAGTLSPNATHGNAIELRTCGRANVNIGNTIGLNIKGAHDDNTPSIMNIGQLWWNPTGTRVISSFDFAMVSAAGATYNYEYALYYQSDMVV